MSSEEMYYVRASEAAKRLGVKTRTLARWRQQGTGPSGWFRLGPTSTMYPVSSLTEFMEKKKLAASSDFVFNFRRHRNV